ncbi:assimilatory sulfite reductase (NADPH) hemoprotein subunit [Aliikangiella coralliicola]|uniref:Sulfite reductase [NADPH] hemoprotein beta-component n=1 Tax=Aliikangiella coralliicola TaxID=2592383 RepID=A0A545UAJ9_9GAMM|nr:assimilatory sulfite reductase (NADPH) hemoprotein subunit [Aliikangiella coralliicola]TQV86492.1 assimilatory sulfite reductase (NADPH) hemoprotein subunit [Aliikangiella coralliicola]
MAIEQTKYDPSTHSDVERIKVESDYLRGTITPSLKNPVTGSVADDDLMLIKFHGIYQQDDRDLRNERRKQKLEPLYSFMIRARVPGGVATSEQYIQMANLATQYSSGSLRLTTRQAYQWHGVFKRNLKTTIAGINQSMLDTIAACGDVNRNVMSNPLPQTSAVHAEVFDWAKKISEHLLPKTKAYHEIWLDGEKVESSQEPIYGETYLPRKFKTAIAIPPYNDVDVYANDLGFIAIIEDEKLIGFNVTIGGGMGSSHGDETTYPRVADVIGFCTLDQVLDISENVVKVQRDFGNREVRKHARLKYTVDTLGLEGFKQKLSAYVGYELAEAKPFEFVHNGDRYGWMQDEKGNWHLTLYIHSGRIVDTDEKKLFTGLLEIAKIHDGQFRISPNQNMIISDIKPETKPKVEALLKKFEISIGETESPTRLNSIACVAFPTCSLAMSEAERYLPTFIDKLEVLLDKYSIKSLPINVRMTGCPNGCGRPFLGEIGMVGKAPGKYNLYLGASHTGHRLNKLYRENINEQQILSELEPILKDYSEERNQEEHFGDFVIRKNYVKAVNNGLDFHS